MASLLLEPEQLPSKLSTLQTAIDTREVYFADAPLTFDQFLEMTGEDDDLELLNGVIVKKMAAQLDHEWLFTWIITVLNGYATKRGLGIVLGSRTAVEINEFDGRLPDILFVREENRNIVQQKAIYGAPDLIIELVSPNDRPIDLRGLESNYRTIGVTEIVFVDRQKKTIRILRKRDNDYTEQTITAGPVILETMDGVTLQAEWVLEEPCPDPIDTVLSLLPSSEPTE